MRFYAHVTEKRLIYLGFGGNYTVKSIDLTGLGI
jgi:hypothetical protein